MTIIDSRSNNNAEPIANAHVLFKSEIQQELSISLLLGMLLSKILELSKIALVMLGKQLIKLKIYLPVVKKLPWLKLSFILLTLFVLFKKDMNVNFTTKVPMQNIIDDHDDYGSVKALPASYKSELNTSLAPANPSSLRSKQVNSFLDQYGQLAIDQMHSTGVPASIKLGQALIESRCGQSMLAEKNNNFFGIKCFSKNCKKGHCTNATDDHHKDFFRKYKVPADSFKHHSQILAGNRYKKLKTYGKNYKKWARGLRTAGYATDKTYDKKLISIIEQYQLYKLDKM